VNVLLLAALMAASLSHFAPTKPTTIRWASRMQGQAFVYGPFPQVASGGWGSGKTWLFCKKGLYLSTEYPRNRGVIIRSVAKELRATTQATFFKTCPSQLYDRRRGGRRNDNEGYVKLADSGSEILFLHMEDPDTAGVIKGLEINWFFIDQAEEKPDKMEEIFDLLLGRLGRWDMAQVPAAKVAAWTKRTGRPWPYLHPESGKPVPPPYPMLACNPDVEVHWLYRRFHPESPEHHEQTIPELDPQTNEPTGVLHSYASLGYKMFHMPSLENQFLTTTNRQFLLAHDSAFIRRNVLGLWGSPEGAIHVVPGSQVIPGSPELLEYFRQYCTLYRTMDYGDSAPTCVLWWAVDRNGNVFAYREYYMPNAMISTHRGNIAGLSEYEHYEQDLADPSIFHTMPSKKGGRFSIADEYAEVVDQPRHTAIFWTAADNNELGTRNRVNEYLRFEPTRVHPITRERGCGRLFFVTANEAYPQGVMHALTQTRSQRRVKIGTNLGKPVFSDERDPDIVDHAYDPVRYMIAGRPPAPPEITGVDVGTFAGARRVARDLQRQLGRTA
jgi:hypothetical protein